MTENSVAVSRRASEKESGRRSRAKEESGISQRKSSRYNATLNAEQGFTNERNSCYDTI